MGNNTEVVFDNIEQRILKEIEEAHYAIFVSVAWFTNKKLFNALLEKAKGNCYVSIIIQLDDINSQCGIDYSQIQVGRSECFMISKEAELLHDKFCVIDFRKVITGSYNWTYKAAHNSENILILNDPSVATQYITRFEQQKSKYAESTVLQRSIKTSDIETSEVTHTTKGHEIKMEAQMIKECSHCQKEIDYTSIFCPHCGTQQSEYRRNRVVKCINCNHEQKEPLLDIEQTRFCTNCGKSTSFNPKILPPPITTIPIPERKICPVCKRIINEENYCPSCGLKSKGLRAEYRSFQQFQSCSVCKTMNPYNANYCRFCGKDMSTHARDHNGHGWVDLGLSVLWSTETMKNFYPWMDSKTVLFMNSGTLDDSEFTNDNKDIATIKWGEKWRTPTKEEFEELINECKWEKVIIPNSDTHALKATGPNGNSIFLPVTGHAGCKRSHNFWNDSERAFNECSFWTSTRDDRFSSYNVKFAYIFTFIGYDSEDITPTLTQKQLIESHFETDDRIRTIFKQYEPWNDFFTRKKNERAILDNMGDDSKEQEKNRTIDKNRRAYLWLNTPLDINRTTMYPHIDSCWGVRGLSIRPVADKKWQGHI